MDSEAYFKRVQEIWFGKLSERYARALSLAFVTWIATSFAIRFDWNWLSNLTTSILDAKPLVFFLLCWCVVRIFELSRVTFFKAKGGDSKLSRRLLDGTTDAATVMLGTYEGVVAGLYFMTRDSCHHTGGALAIIIAIYAIAAPFFMASKAFSIDLYENKSLKFAWFRALFSSAVVIVMICSLPAEKAEKMNPCSANQASTSAGAHAHPQK